jgi:protein involved in polysaccharide export with SLBB domain
MLWLISHRSRLSVLTITMFIAFYFLSFFQELEAVNSSFQSEQTQTVSNKGYFIPGDAVQISVYPDTTTLLNNVFPIDAKGYVFLPILGKVQISNMDIIELERFLESNYSKYLRVTIVKTRPLIKAGLVGGFTRPGFYYVHKNETLWDLLSKGVAVTSNKGFEKMEWKRDRETVDSKLEPLLQSNLSLEEIGFKSGDQIFTPIPVPPRRGVFWENVMPLLTFALTVYTVYISYYFYYQSSYNR